MVENLPANAGDAGSSPGLGRSHMPWSNSAREPQLLSLHVWSLCSATRGHDSERPAHRDEEMMAMILDYFLKNSGTDSNRRTRAPWKMARMKEFSF